MPNAEGLLSIIKDLKSDPNLREFEPILDHMIAGIENPIYDNTEQLLDLFLTTLYSCMCREIAVSLYLNQSPPEKKKWYDD